jgi:hypothetical protein
MLKTLAPLIQAWHKPSPAAVAAQDLYAAEHALLAARNELEWAQARITAYETRIARLREFIKEAA